MNSHLQWPSIYPEFPRQTPETGIFTKTFPRSPCLFFCWSRPMIESSVLGAEIPCPLDWVRTSSWTSQKYNLLHITSKIYVPLLLPNNFFVCNLKVFILTKSHLCHFWYLEGSWLNVFPSLFFSSQVEYN